CDAGRRREEEARRAREGDGEPARAEARGDGTLLRRRGLEGVEAAALRAQGEGPEAGRPREQGGSARERGRRRRRREGIRALSDEGLQEREARQAAQRSRHREKSPGRGDGETAAGERRGYGRPPEATRLGPRQRRERRSDG